MKKIFFSSLLVLLTMVGIVPHLAAQEEGTPQYGVELLTNIPPAATDFTGWTTSGSVQCSDGWFKTSKTECTISQTINLSAQGYTPITDNTHFLYAATEYKVGWANGNQDGIAQMYVECLDADNNVLATNYFLSRTGKFGTVDPTRVCDMFSIPANTTQLRYVLRGKDQCNWGSFYGTWFRNMSCKVYDNTKFNESIQVSVAPELRDSLTLSKTSNFYYGDTITVSPTYPEYPIVSITLNEGKVINTNQVVCWGENTIISARLKYPNTITCNGTHAKITADKAKASIGDVVTLSYTLDENYVLGSYTTNINVTWIDANSFIMPDAPVTVGNTAIAAKSLPYFEGFENGNTQNAVVADWLQQNENGNNSWVANTSYTIFNCTPYAGSWNAYLYGNNTDWLFQAYTLEAGTTYAFSMRARSYNSAKILVKLGNQANKDAMSVTLVPDTILSTTDYQYLTGRFTVERTGTYAIGVRGYSTSSNNYTSIDDIQVREAQPHAITCTGTLATLIADKTEAIVGDTVTLTLSMEAGYVLRYYTTNITVTWVDANRFIMPDEAITIGNTAIAAKPVPYFEGFEKGNTQDVLVSDWLQHSESGGESWVANTANENANRKPYAGSWNATLQWSNTDWLLQALDMEAGENYVLSLYARQDKLYTSYANITATLGTACTIGAMTTTLIPKTGLTNGDYQLLTDTFQVAETKAYVLGIKGYISDDPYYISMDNIMVEQEVYPASVDTLYFDVLTEGAARTALAALSLTAADTKGNTKHSFDNLAENWVLDLVNHTATYTVADSLLPMGYFFADSTETIIVNLIDKHTVTATAGENGSVKMEVNDKETTETIFDYGTEITLTAIANEGYFFLHWSDGTKGATYTFTLTQDTVLTAIFGQYGEELLTNIPPAATNFTGWTTSGIVKCSEGWFKTSNDKGTISQTIDLTAHGYTPVAANTLFLYAATEYKVGWAIGRQDGIARMYVECLDADNKVLATNDVLNRTGKFGMVDSTRVCDMFSIPANTTQVRYVLIGQDQCYWGGYFGTWFRNMSCKVYDNTKFNESIQVSVAPELVDSITLSKTSNFHYGDTITVSPTYPERPILWLTLNEGKIINTNQVVCFGENIVISAHLKYPHAITLNGTHAILTADKIEAGMGDTVTLSSSMEDGYALGRYTTNINVTWIDANRFIIPDAPVAVGNTAITVKSLPYFEGFENGNTQGSVVADWLQQSENGTNSWVANTSYTDYNRKPYAGSSWNATLHYSNTDWLFQALSLEAGENYVLSLYARQDSQNTLYANITAKLGTACSKDAMTTTLIPETGLTNGNYQLLTDTFQVAETKAYVLGIRGYISGSPYYISMDNILVEQEVYPASVDTLYFDVLSEDVARTALAALSLTAADTKGNTKHTFDNLAENWVLDLVNHTATYTVADSLLPMGYFFADSTETIIVNLIDKHTVTATAENGSVIGAGTYDYGTEVTLTATAEEGYHFVQWSNDTWANPYVLTLTNDTTLMAVFEKDPEYNAVGGLFSVGEGTQVQFSAGNLQYSQFAKVWSFAAEQYEVIGEANVVNDTLAGKIDIFGWSGNAGSAKWGVSTSEDYNDYSGNFVDWGQNIGDGTTWRTLTKDEWNYLCKTRANATDLIGVARINLDETGTSYVNGLILLPDTWTCPEGVTFKSGLANDFSTQAYAGHQTFTLEQWEKLESAGAVFLPAAGYRIGENIDDVQFLGVYWSATPGDLHCAYYLYFYSSEGYLSNYLGYYGKAVRLVQDCYTVATTCDETSGNIIGGGIYPKGTLVTLTAIPTVGYHFVQWSDGTTEATYTFTLTQDTTITATFAIDRHTVTISKAVNGTVSGESGTFDYGTEVTLAATPAEGYHFVQWSNGCWANPYVFTLTKDTTISAIIEAEPVYNAVNGIFSVADGKHIEFSSGNLQYSQFAKVWSFAAEQYEMIGEANVVNDKLAGKIDLFGWSGSTGIAKWGISISTDYNDYSGDFVDWGENIGDGTTWRTLTTDEWNYLCNTRANATDLIGVARINLDETGTSYINGLILLPDTWTCPEGVTFKSGFSTEESIQAYADYQTFTLEQWEKLESAGAVFLPASGNRGAWLINNVHRSGIYLSSSTANNTAVCLGILSNWVGKGYSDRFTGQAIRLVQDCYTVATTCDETSGNIIGGGIYPKGTLVTLTAQANTGYTFDKWSDGNTDNPRTITVTEDVALEAIFKQDAPTQLSETDAETKVEKVLRNGQVFIIRNGNTYDLTGRKAE